MQQSIAMADGAQWLVARQLIELLGFPRSLLGDSMPGPTPARRRRRRSGDLLDRVPFGVVVVQDPFPLPHESRLHLVEFPEYISDQVM